MATHAKAKATNRSRAERHPAQPKHENRAGAITRDIAARSGDVEASPGQVSDTAFADFLAGKWGTASEACRYLSLSLSVLRRETRRGRIKAYVVGGRKLVRYRRSDLDAYLLESQTVVPFTQRSRA